MNTHIAPILDFVSLYTHSSCLIIIISFCIARRYNMGGSGAHSNCKSFWESEASNVLFNELKTNYSTHWTSSSRFYYCNCEVYSEDRLPTRIYDNKRYRGCIYDSRHEESATA